MGTDNNGNTSIFWQGVIITMVVMAASFVSLQYGGKLTSLNILAAIFCTAAFEYIALKLRYRDKLVALAFFFLSFPPSLFLLIAAFPAIKVWLAALTMLLLAAAIFTILVRIKMR